MVELDRASTPATPAAPSTRPHSSTATRSETSWPSATWRGRRGTSRVSGGARTVRYPCGARARNSVFPAAARGQKKVAPLNLEIRVLNVAFYMRTPAIPPSLLKTSWCFRYRLREGERELFVPSPGTDSCCGDARSHAIRSHWISKARERAGKWRARRRHCNPPAGKMAPPLLETRRPRRPSDSSGRPASGTVQSSGFESSSPPRCRTRRGETREVEARALGASTTRRLGEGGP